MHFLSPRHRRSRRCVAIIAAVAFVWSFVLATPAQALARSAMTPHKRLGLRVLSETEMSRLSGRGGGLHMTSIGEAGGSTYPWEGTIGGSNTANGNKLTLIPIVSWTQRGGMPVSLSFAHSSQSNHNSELGYKFTHSFDIYLAASGTGGDLAVHWGDDLSYVFAYHLGSFTAPAGIHETLVKNVDNTYTLTKPDQTSVHFKTNLYCDTISDENSNSISISYNTGNYVTSIADCTSRSIALSYDTSNRISTVTDPLSRVWTCHYTSGNLTSVDLPTIGGSTYSWGMSYNTNHDITTLTTPGGRSSSTSYNTVDDSIATETDGCGNVTTWTEYGTTTIADPNGNSVVHAYSGGLLSSVTDQASNVESYVYDSSNNRTQVTDNRGYVWNYSFDSAGNCLTSETPYGDTTTRTFSSHNRLLTSTDPLGHVTQTVVYDSHDNPTSVTDGLSHTTSTTWTTHGLPDTVTDSLSHSTSFSWDSDGNCVLVVDPNSNQVSATFDGLGHKLTATDELSHTTTWTLDAWSRVSSVATPAGTTSMVHDPDGLVTSVTDDNSHTTSQTFDNNGRPLVTTRANGDTFTNSWDATGKKGLLSSTTDGNSHSTVFSYTVRNEKSGVTYADSTTEGWSFNANGDVASHTDGRGYTTNFTVDHAGRLTGIDFPHDTDVSFVYDAAGRKTSMVDGTGTTGWTYDNANRCTQIAQPNGTVTYGFDNANRRTSMAISGTGTWSYGFDAANRLISTTNPNSETTGFTLDYAGRCTRQDNGNSTYALNTFDSANRITRIQTKNSSATVLSDILYGYDGVNVTSRTDTDGTVTNFGYDASDQLNSEVRDNSHGTGYSISYTYDHNQNRTSKTIGGVTDTYSYSSHDRLTSTSSKSFYYDGAGNCTSVVVGGNTTSLTWSDDNRLTGITYPSTATNSFSYNGEGLRVGKTDSAGTSSPITDGTAPASAVLKDARAVYTPGLSERTTGTGAASKFYHGDALGSTRGITNSSQTVTDAVLYDAFGMTVSRTGTTATPFGFVGAAQYQSDGDSGLQLLGNRLYDPSIGRFISSDPAKAGTNWYVYTENDPVGNSDPTGLDVLHPEGYWDGDPGGQVIWGPPPPRPRPRIGGSPGTPTIPIIPIIPIVGPVGGVPPGGGPEPPASSKPPVFKIRRPGVGGSAAKDDIPSWVRTAGYKPFVGETPVEFADRVMEDAIIGGITPSESPGMLPGPIFRTGPGSQHSRIRKWASSAWMDPPAKK